MDSTLTLRSAVWNKDLRRSILNKMLSRSASVLDKQLHDNIDNSTPAGRYYGRGSITAKKTSANKNLRKAPGRSTRVIVGTRLIRASAEGQPPARRTSRLYNSLKVRRSQSELKIIAEVNAPGAAILDDPKRLNRPYFRSIIAKFRREDFVNEAKKAVHELVR